MTRFYRTIRRVTPGQFAYNARWLPRAGLTSITGMNARAVGGVPDPASGVSDAGCRIPRFGERERDCSWSTVHEMARVLRQISPPHTIRRPNFSQA